MAVKLLDSKIDGLKRELESIAKEKEPFWQVLQ